LFSKKKINFFSDLDADHDFNADPVPPEIDDSSISAQVGGSLSRQLDFIAEQAQETALSGSPQSRPKRKRNPKRPRD
jgi:hypothetical protein